MTSLKKVTFEFSLPWKEQRRFICRLNTFVINHFQQTATDAFQSMAEVLMKESSVGKSYEAVLDGARSVASGLGSVLRVSSYMARAYAISDSYQDSSSLYRRRRSSGKSRKFVGLKALERLAAKDRSETKEEVM